MLLVAIGCGRIPDILERCRKKTFVVFGTMDEKHLSSFADRAKGNMTDTPVYFYETG